MKNKKAVFRGALLFVSVFVVLYALYNLFGLIKSGYDVVSAENTTVYKTVDAQAFVTREETLLTYSGNGTVAPLAENAEKVAAGTPVAGVFSTATAADYYAQTLRLKETLAGYRRISSQRALENVNIPHLTEQVQGDFCNVVDCVYEGDYGSLEQAKTAFLVDASRLQISLDSEIDCTEKIAAAEGRLSSLQSTAVPESTVTAGQSGYYAATADGYENTLPVASLNGINVAQLQKIMQSEPKAVADNCVGKIVSGFYWYLAAVVDSDGVSTLEKGDKCRVIIGSSGTDMVQCELTSITRQSDGKAAVVLRCGEMTKERLALRKVNIKIVLGEYTGLKVPKSALRKVKGEEDYTDEKTGKDATRQIHYDCVYVRLGNVTKLRYLNVVYSTENFVIASDNGKFYGSKAHLKNHDSIILNGKGLGK